MQSKDTTLGRISFYSKKGGSFQLVGGNSLNTDISTVFIINRIRTRWWKLKLRWWSNDACLELQWAVVIKSYYVTLTVSLDISGPQGSLCGMQSSHDARNRKNCLQDETLHTNVVIHCKYTFSALDKNKMAAQKIIQRSFFLISNDLRWLYCLKVW